MFWTTLIGVLIFTASSGIALGAALGLTGLVILHFFANGSTYLAVDVIWGVFNSFTLSAVPMFILLGEILLRSSVSERAIRHLRPYSPVYRAGFCSNIAVSTLFAAAAQSLHGRGRGLCRLPGDSCVCDKKVVVGSLAGGGTLDHVPPSSRCSSSALSRQHPSAGCS